MSDDELMQEIAKGNRPAFAFLVDRYQDRVHGLLRRIANDFHLAEDWAQLTFIRVYKSAKTYDSAKSNGGVLAWLFQIAINVAKTETKLRLKRSEVPVPASTEQIDVKKPVWEPEDHQPGPSVHAQTVEILEKALRTLDLEERMAFCLRHLTALPIGEIAAAMDCKVWTVQRRLKSARNRIRKVLIDNGFDPGIVAAFFDKSNDHPTGSAATPLHKPKGKTNETGANHAER